MPVSLDMFPNTAMVGGTVSRDDVASLARDDRLKSVELRADSPRETWEALNDHLLQTRPDVILAVDSFWPGGADLSQLRYVSNARRLCVTSSGTEAISSLESIAMLPHLESLQIGSPSLESFEVLKVLPPDRLRELRLADTQPQKLSIRVLERFTALDVLRIEGHTVDLDAVESLKSLRQLTLSNVRLKDLILLRSLPNLVSFVFHASAVKDAEVLAELVGLRHLALCPTSGFASVDFLASMSGLEMIGLQNMPKVTEFPSLSRLTQLRRISIQNLKRLESLRGLAEAPSLHAYLHLAVPLEWTPEHFRAVLEHPTLRQFTAIVGGPKKDVPIREMAARMGKSPVEASPENPFTFRL